MGGQGGINGGGRGRNVHGQIFKKQNFFWLEHVFKEYQ